MAIKDALIPEFDHEMAVTRKTLERVPEDKPDYKPHEKSMSMSRLAGHVAELPGFVTMALQNDSFNIRPAGGGPARQPLVMGSRKQLLEDFDKNVASMRETLSKASDESLMKSWSLMAGDKTILTMPRAAVVRSFCLSHIIHHRAQLGVYLRMNNVPVPSVYGPSADENPFAEAMAG
ncbi:MAG TPA: DinB family protein [Candidatus Acidoferrales bacterium]|jgi:uncharacterized damage-inducible protein DinB|nr:DinB family protein [Candidatus Acidoferrales bacterium]